MESSDLIFSALTTCVVADTSPINYLVAIGRIDVLPALYGQVIIPLAVLRELQSPRAPVAIRKWISSPPAWLVTQEVIASFPGADDLDSGERDAIQLALDLGAQVLIDERDGQRVAEHQGLKTTGTIGILEAADATALLQFDEAFNALLLTSFRISRRLIQQVQQRRAQL
jgi:predicted nucleic acid-binding protein